MMVLYLIAGAVVAWFAAWLFIGWFRTRRLRAISTMGEAGRRGPPLRYLHPLHGLHGLPGDVPLAAGRYAVGRDETNDIVLSSPFVSRHHAILHVASAGVRIQCLPTAKGVFVRRVGTDHFEDGGNGEVPVGPQDIVALGKPSLQVWFSLPAAASGAARPAPPTPASVGPGQPPLVRPATTRAPAAHQTAVMQRDEDEDVGTMALPAGGVTTAGRGGEGPGTDGGVEWTGHQEGGGGGWAGPADEDEAPTFRIGLKRVPPVAEPRDRADPRPGPGPRPSPPRRGRPSRRARPAAR